jgi:E3 ubiquitin-protein ligase UBR1
MILQGRDVIEVAGDARRLFETAHKISAIDLTVTMRRALEVFREHAAAVVIEWLFDLMQTHIAGQGQVLQELVAAELFAPRNLDKSLHPEVLAAYPEVENGTRLDWLFLYHTRLWKRPRLNLKQIYVTMLTLSHKHRLTVGESILFLSRGPLTVPQPSAMPMSSTASSTPTSSSTAKPKPPSNSLP